MLRTSDDALVFTVNPAGLESSVVYTGNLQSWTDAVAVNAVVHARLGELPKGRRPRIPLLDVVYRLPVIKLAWQFDRGVYPLDCHFATLGSLADMQEMFESSGEARCGQCESVVPRLSWLAPTQEGVWVCGSCMLDVMRRRALPSYFPITGGIAHLEDAGKFNMQLMADANGRVYLAATGQYLSGMEYVHATGTLVVTRTALGGGEKWVRSHIETVSDTSITVALRKGTSPAMLDSSLVQSKRRGSLYESKRLARLSLNPTPKQGRK